MFTTPTVLSVVLHIFLSCDIGLVITGNLHGLCSSAGMACSEDFFGGFLLVLFSLIVVDVDKDVRFDGDMADDG